MKTLVIAEYIPMPDRQAGYFRFFNFLRIIAETHQLFYYACELEYQVKHYGTTAVASYGDQLKELGIDVLNRQGWGALQRFLRREKIDVALFEHYNWAREHISDVRFWQPDATIVIDTVDLVFQRLFSKARATQRANDVRDARQTKARELSTYRRADVVLAISEADKRTLKQEDRRLDVEVIPLIHPIPALTESNGLGSSALLFIGNFEHTANVDAMLYFCRDVLPLVRKELPDVQLTIVGNAPPVEVKGLAADGIDVAGYVSDIKPYYAANGISIAPLTWGGGLKGKITEALAFGLPVVSTTVGIDGFGLTHRENVMVGDTAQEFADAIVTLSRDKGLYNKIRANGWQFTKEHYSEDLAVQRIKELFEKLEHHPVKKLSMAKAFEKRVSLFLERHVLWRFKAR